VCMCVLCVNILTHTQIYTYLYAYIHSSLSFADSHVECVCEYHPPLSPPFVVSITHNSNSTPPACMFRPSVTNPRVLRNAQHFLVLIFFYFCIIPNESQFGMQSDPSSDKGIAPGVPLNTQRFVKIHLLSPSFSHWW